MTDNQAGKGDRNRSDPKAFRDAHYWRVKEGREAHSHAVQELRDHVEIMEAEQGVANWSAFVAKTIRDADTGVPSSDQL